MDEQLKNYKNYVNQFRAKYIPKQYNQIKLVDELFNDEIDHYISISNRSDGKSFNYIHFFLNFAIDYKVNFCLICRKFTVRESYEDLLTKIVRKSKRLDEKMLTFFTTQFYYGVMYDGEEVGIIIDLNSATNLKYMSNYICDFPIMIYDEFLAIEGDYLPDEWEKLKTIYSSINREFDLPLIKYPKVFYLGNAVNFSSPILSNLKIFNILENHPINTAGIYGNIYLEMRRNENSNEERNLRAFNEELDDLTKGQFRINKYRLATDYDREKVLKDRHKIVVKLDNSYLEIEFNENIIILSIIGYSDKYDFNTNIVDNSKDSTYLKEQFYNDNEIKKYNAGLYIFDNAYSKEYILSSNLINLNIRKIIKSYMMKYNHDEQMVRQFKDNYQAMTIRSIINKFMR